MNLARILITFVLAAGLALAGCGGGGGGIASTGGGGGIGGTGITSTGTIDGFGSIFVNGVEFETDKSAVSLDGEPSTPDDLGLGMVVTVRGTVNEDGRTGTADEVSFDDEVQGPVSSIEISPDGDVMQFTVLGVKIIAKRTGTVFDDVSFDTLVDGDLVEVSGYFENQLQLSATRIEKKDTFVPGTSEVELKGTVSGLIGTQFFLNEFLVDYSSADLSNIPGGSIINGMQVEVRGTLNNNIIFADRVEEEDDISSGFDNQDEVSVEGAISNFVGKGDFEVNGVAVDATSASLEPAGLVLENGVIVEAEGTWNGSVLVAKEVHSRSGEVELGAQVASVNTTAGTITLQYVAGTVTVEVDSRTVLQDETGQMNPLTLGGISAGNFIEVAAIMNGDSLLATYVHRKEQDDNILQAPVDGFSFGVNITLLGITFSTAGAEFEDQNDSVISSPEIFFGQLGAGDLVKVKDEELADGVADEVELE